MYARRLPPLRRASRGGDDLEALRTLAGELGIVIDLDGTVSAMDAAGCSVGQGRVLLGGRAPALAE